VSHLLKRSADCIHLSPSTRERLRRVVFTAENIELDVGPIRSRADALIRSGDEQPDGSEDRLESEPETTS
jgi:hypothetical protein